MFIYVNNSNLNMQRIISSSYIIDYVDRDWGNIDENGSWTGAVRRVMDGVSTLLIYLASA